MTPVVLVQAGPGLPHTPATSAPGASVRSLQAQLQAVRSREQEVEKHRGTCFCHSAWVGSETAEANITFKPLPQTCSLSYEHLERAVCF